MQRTNHGSVARFFEEKGFYIILLLCLAAIGISGYVLFFAPEQAQPLDTVEYQPNITAEEITPVIGAREDIPVEPVTEPVTVPDSTESTTAASTQDAAATQAQVPTPAVFVRPAAGEIRKPFSGEVLVFHETMGDWRAHTGTDYVVNAGDRIYAMTDGTVDDVYNDALYGTCIVLSHADDLVTTYKGLSDSLKVNTGDTVRAGDIIGTVGVGNLAEADNGACLHIEATKQGQRIDPESLFS